MSVLKRNSKTNIFNAVCNRFLEEAPHFLYDPSYIWIVGLILWNIEILINYFVIHRVSCTKCFDV